MGYMLTKKSLVVKCRPVGRLREKGVERREKGEGEEELKAQK
jgi:hypothetical protein